ncbi:MAG: signal peptidase I [Armatimonadetes bacterium]|nr:signal peptidase I [Armatimonadota bacterium]
METVAGLPRITLSPEQLILFVVLLIAVRVVLHLVRTRHHRLNVILEEALASEDPEIRCKAVEAIGSVGDRTFIPLLRQALGDKDSVVRVAAAETLHGLGDHSGRPVVAEVARNGNSRGKILALNALAKIGVKEAVPILYDSLGHSDPTVRLKAAQVLARLSDKNAMEELERQLGGKDLTNRIESAALLGRIKNVKYNKINEYIESFIIAGVLALLIISFVARTFYIPSESMVPTLQKNDYILVNLFMYKLREPKRGEIVVFKPPIPGEKRDFIKRVIGLPGETLEVRDGLVLIDGHPLSEDYIKSPPDYTFGPIKIPPRKLLVFGDNRTNSQDSHAWENHFLPYENLEGKAIFLLRLRKL